MSRLTLALLGGLCAALTACAPPSQNAKAPLTEDDVSPIAYDKMQAFNVWLEEQKGKDGPKAFEPRPMMVSGVGRVRAAPDIAVIVGTITTQADKDSVAVDEAAYIINAVQEAVKGRDVELNFTQVRTSDKRDEVCLAHNRKVTARHSRILQDNRYNANIKRQKEQGRDVKIKPREPRLRFSMRVCPVTHIEASLTFSARVKPANEAGNIINDFTSAGVTDVDLFGYDFTDYDALYKEAAAKAVKNAKDKAERVARIAGTDLTEIVSFYVDSPQRTSRFGPQAMIVSNHGNRTVASGQYSNMSGAVMAPMPAPAPVASYMGWDGSVFSDPSQAPMEPIMSEYGGGGADEITVTATRRVAPPLNPNMGAANNTLKMSLQAGQRTITVNAKLSYLYKTPIDGTIVPEPKS